MGKKRGAAAAAPVFPFPAADDEPRHFSDYGFDDDCFSYATAKRPAAARRHDQHQPPPMESARFKLQKPISKKHHHNKKQQQQQQRRRWWSSALLFFKRGSSSDATASVDPSSYRTNALSPAGPLYLAVEDEGDDGAAAACACWAPAMRSGHLAASELGASAAVFPYVILRGSAVGGGRGAPPPPAMPIYLVT